MRTKILTKKISLIVASVKKRIKKLKKTAADSEH